MKAKKFLALLLSMLMLVSSMAVGVLPVLAEESDGAALPIIRVNNIYASATDGWSLSNQITGLTAGEVYTVSMLFKNVVRASFVTVDGVEIIRGDEPSNGASYNVETSLLTYTFTATKESANVIVDQISHYTTTDIAALTVADITGNVIYAPQGVYTDGALTKIEGWNYSWNNHYVYLDGSYADFGAIDPATCEHAYDNDCDILCDICGAFRVTTGHAYDDKYDEDCNNCGETRFVATYIPVGSLHYWGSSDGNFWVNAYAEGLTIGEEYTVSLLCKTVYGTGLILKDGVTLLSGTTAMNGANYDAAKGHFTYNFMAESSEIRLKLHLNGTSQFDIGAFTVVDKTGAIVFASEPTIIEGNYTMTGVGPQWWSVGYYTVAEDAITYFGVTDPKNCTEHVYDDDCDIFCNVCCTARTIEGHVYDDDADAYCNTCRDLRLPAVATLIGSKLQYGSAWVKPEMGTQYFARTLDMLTPGETYTLTTFFKADVAGAFLLNDVILVKGSVAENGATYNAANSLLTYTFVAVDKDEDGITDDVIKTDLLGKEASEYAIFAGLKIADISGNVVYTPAYVEGDTTKLEGWYGNGSYAPCQYSYVAEYAYSFFGANELKPACTHRYAGPCDPVCVYCGATREVSADAHLYDDENDTRCNYCLSIRPGYVNMANGFGYANENTLGWTNGATGLTVGEQYTLSFLWKCEGVPFFYVGDSSKKIMEGMVPVNGATIDYETCRVTYTFTATASDIGFGMIMNTAETNYSKFWMADVTIVDSEGNLAYQNNDATDPTKGWGWTGWSNNWNANPYTYTFTDVRPEDYFTCPHKYENSCDTDCDYCGAMRLINHTYENDCDTDCDVCGEVRAVAGHAYDNACDADCNNCGALREIEHTYANACDAECDICGTLRDAGDHEYANACDADCNVCGAIRDVEDHVYDDDQDTDCNVCGEVREVASARVPGDVNGDGEVDNIDLMMMQRFLAEWDLPTFIEANADVNADDEVDNIDLMMLQRYLADWDIVLK